MAALTGITKAAVKSVPKSSKILGEMPKDLTKLIKKIHDDELISLLEGSKISKSRFNAADSDKKSKYLSMLAGDFLNKKGFDKFGLDDYGRPSGMDKIPVNNDDRMHKLGKLHESSQRKVRDIKEGELQSNQESSVDLIKKIKNSQNRFDHFDYESKPGSLVIGFNNKGEMRSFPFGLDNSEGKQIGKNLTDAQQTLNDYWKDYREFKKSGKTVDPEVWKRTIQLLESKNPRFDSRQVQQIPNLMYDLQKRVSKAAEPFQIKYKKKMYEGGLSNYENELAPNLDKDGNLILDLDDALIDDKLGRELGFPQNLTEDEIYELDNMTRPIGKRHQDLTLLSQIANTKKQPNQGNKMLRKLEYMAEHYPNSLPDSVKSFKNYTDPEKSIYRQRLIDKIYEAYPDKID